MALETQLSTTSKNTRKRQKKYNTWKAVVAKVARNSRLPGISKNGKAFKARVMGPGCTCRSKYNEKITRNEHLLLHKNFWEIGNYSRQWDYLSRCITTNEVKERKVSSDDVEVPRKMKSCTYHLMTSSGHINVCRIMLLDTFGNNNYIYYLNYVNITVICPSWY